MDNDETFSSYRNFLSTVKDRCPLQTVFSQEPERTHILSHTHRHTQIHRHILSHKHRDTYNHTDRQTHTITHTDTYNHTDTQTHTDTHKNINSKIHSDDIHTSPDFGK